MTTNLRNVHRNVRGVHQRRVLRVTFYFGTYVSTYFFFWRTFAFFLNVGNTVFNPKWVIIVRISAFPTLRKKSKRTHSVENVRYVCYVGENVPCPRYVRSVFVNPENVVSKIQKKY